MRAARRAESSSTGVGRLRVEVDERRLHLAQHLADRDAEDALAAADEVDDLVVRRAQVDRCAVAHERGAGEIADAGCAELLDRGADLLQRDAGVEQALDELQDQDVAEAVEPLRTRAARAADGGLDELGARPVVELAIGDAGGAGGDGAAVADLVVHLRKSVGEEEIGDERLVVGGS